MMRKSIPILTILLFSVCGALYGQVISSSIVGRVTDASGAPVPAVGVTLKNTETGVAVNTVTDTSGTYSVPEVLSGLYEVTAIKDGFQASTVSGIRVLSSATVRVDISLKVGSVKQEVTVVGRAPLVHTDTTNISASITTRQLADLPTSLQTIDAFMALGPGVQSLPGTDSNNPPIGGGTHWGSVNFTLNGVGANQPGNSGGVDVQGVGMLVLPPPSSIQELKIQSNDMSAQYKGHSNVSMVIKNGTNGFHGTAYEYIQNTSLNANQFLLNAKGQPRPPQHLNQFGGNLGGPIKRGKAFFFFDYNGYRHQDSAVAQHLFPST